MLSVIECADPTEMGTLGGLGGQAPPLPNAIVCAVACCVITSLVPLCDYLLSIRPHKRRDLTSRWPVAHTVQRDGSSMTGAAFATLQSSTT